MRWFVSWFCWITAALLVLGTAWLLHAQGRGSQQALLASYGSSGGGAGSISFDNATGSNPTFGEQNMSSGSFSYTMGSGTDGALFVGVCIIDTGGPISVTGITFDTTQNFTQAPSPAGRHVGMSTNATELWYLLAPHSGSHTLAITMSGSPAQVWIAGAISLFGVNQSSPIEAQGASDNTSGSPSTSVTTSNTNDWILDVVEDNNSDTGLHMATSPQVIRFTQDNATRACLGSTKGPVASAGSTTMSWSGWLSSWTQNVIAIKHD